MINHLESLGPIWLKRSNPSCGLVTIQIIISLYNFMFYFMFPIVSDIVTDMELDHIIGVLGIEDSWACLKCDWVHSFLPFRKIHWRTWIGVPCHSPTLSRAGLVPLFVYYMETWTKVYKSQKVDHFMHRYLLHSLAKARGKQTSYAQVNAHQSIAIRKHQ